jgi:hypothetical protein
MTTAFRKSPLWASPETVGNGIYWSIIKNRNVAYLPWFWRWVMAMIQVIPESIFKHMNV